MLIFNTHERAEPVSSEAPTFSSPVGELGEGAVTSQAGFSHPKQPPTMCYFHESNVDMLPKFCYFPYLPNYKKVHISVCTCVLPVTSQPSVGRVSSTLGKQRAHLEKLL